MAIIHTAIIDKSWLAVRPINTQQTQDALCRVAVGLERWAGALR
jgi:hypothetical protein